MQVIFSNRAYASIISEIHERPNLETGGIFLGCHKIKVWYVLESIDPGPNAVFDTNFFEYDREYTEHLINRTASIYQDEMSLIGLWHKHPDFCNTFSSVDDETNIKFAQMSSSGAISVIVNVDPAIRLSTFHVKLPLTYTKIKYMVGDNKIPEQLLQLKDYL